MGLRQNLLIDQKLLEFKREKGQWWRITKSSRRVNKFILIGIVAIDQLASVVGACGASFGFSKFYKSRGKGNRMLVVQRCHNSFGQFLSSLKFGQER